MMDRIDQTEFGPRGNCYSACLAMVLGLELAEVPNFNDMGETDNQINRAAMSWLADRGWVSVRLGCNGEPGVRNVMPRGPCIVGGESHRGAYHGVVYLNGKPFHDPHPDRTWLVSIADLEILAPLEPWMVVFVPTELP